MEDGGEGAVQPAQNRHLSRTVPSSSQAEARAQSIKAARDKLQAGVSIARTALQEFGSIASVASIQAIEKRVQTTKKRHIKSPFCRVEKEEAKTDLMNAACGVYQLLYAPKGHTNNMHAAEWAISRVRSLAWAFLFAVLGVIVAVWENEVLWANNRVPSIQSFWLKVLCVVLTAVSLYFIRNYYRAVIAQERLRGIPLHNGHVSMLNLQSIGIWWQALLDLICLLPMPIPFLMYEFEVYNDTTKSSVTYQLDVLLTVFMFLRIRLFPRFFGECLSGVGTDSARAYGNISRLVMGESFIFKYLITSNLSMVLTLWFTQIVFFGYCLMLFERPMSFNPIAHSQLHEIASALWCTVITMTIVGYGDVYPQTRLGRCTMMVASISALIMVAISTNIVKVLLTMSRAEEKCMQVRAVAPTPTGRLSRGAALLVLRPFGVHALTQLVCPCVCVCILGGRRYWG